MYPSMFSLSKGLMLYLPNNTILTGSFAAVMFSFAPSSPIWNTFLQAWYMWSFLKHYNAPTVCLWFRIHTNMHDSWVVTTALRLSFIWLSYIFNRNNHILYEAIYNQNKSNGNDGNSFIFAMIIGICNDVDYGILKNVI